MTMIFATVMVNGTHPQALTLCHAKLGPKPVHHSQTRPSFKTDRAQHPRLRTGMGRAPAHRCSEICRLSMDIQPREKKNRVLLPACCELLAIETRKSFRCLISKGG